jgi:hypothetical protein
LDPRQNIPSQQFTSQQWQDWYGDLRSYFSRKDANEIWEAFWKKRQSDDANDNALRTYMKKQGVVVETGLLGELRDEGGNIIDGIGNIFGFAKWTLLIVGGVILVPIAILLFNVARKPFEAAKAAQGFTPAGHAGNALKR